MPAKKRVACFYRVSTKKQLDKNDIPMQKNACREFIKKHSNWVLVKEYTEKGISGIKIGSEDRDEIQRALLDAKNKKYDILLCFMKDRLGRKEDDTPFIVENLIRMGVEVWAVEEGQQKIENRYDKLMNYLYFWNAGSESEKTSIRVNEKHEQMVREGIFRGGSIPFGYKAVPSGKINKEGRELLKIEIDEQEAEIVRLIFNLVLEKGYGGNRIANYLNEHGFLTRTGKKWIMGTVNYMLRNPMYKGYLVYGRTAGKCSKLKHCQPVDKWILSEKPNSELVIIPEEKWDKVQQIRSSRRIIKFKKQNENENENVITVPSHGQLLLTGFAKCGHCGSNLISGYDYKIWKTNDGKTHRVQRLKYRCSGKKLAKECDGQATYSQNKIEKSVIDEVYQYLNELGEVDFDKEINKLVDLNLKSIKSELDRLIKTNEQNKIDLKTLNNEVVKSLRGQSSFKPELLSSLIEEKENQINEIEEKIKKLSDEVKNKKIELSDLMKLKDSIPTWKDVFNKGDLDTKKMMLSSLLDTVQVYKDKIEVHIKVKLEQFIRNVQNQKMGMTLQLSRESA